MPKIKDFKNQTINDALHRINNEKNSDSDTSLIDWNFASEEKEKSAAEKIENISKVNNVTNDPEVSSESNKNSKPLQLSKKYNLSMNISNIKKERKKLKKNFTEWQEIKKSTFHYEELSARVDELIAKLDEMETEESSSESEPEPEQKLQPKPVKPEPVKERKKIILEKKIFLPVKKFPRINYHGRIVGPKGSIIKKLIKDSGCYVVVRGKGLKHPKNDSDEELHVMISVCDFDEAAEKKVKNAVEMTEKILFPESCVSSSYYFEGKKKALVEVPTEEENKENLIPAELEKEHKQEETEVTDKNKSENSIDSNADLKSTEILTLPNRITVLNQLSELSTIHNTAAKNATQIIDNHLQEHYFKMFRAKSQNLDLNQKGMRNIFMRVYKAEQIYKMGKEANEMKDKAFESIDNFLMIYPGFSERDKKKMELEMGNEKEKEKITE